MKLRHLGGLALVITALSTVATASARRAYAQYVQQGYSDADRSNGDSAAGGNEEQPESECLCTGTVHDSDEGKGNLTLIVDQDHLTNFFISWNSENFADGTMKVG